MTATMEMSVSTTVIWSCWLLLEEIIVLKDGCCGVEGMNCRSHYWRLGFTIYYKCTKTSHELFDSCEHSSGLIHSMIMIMII